MSARSWLKININNERENKENKEKKAKNKERKRKKENQNKGNLPWLIEPHPSLYYLSIYSPIKIHHLGTRPHNSANPLLCHYGTSWHTKCQYTPHTIYQYWISMVWYAPGSIQYDEPWVLFFSPFTSSRSRSEYARLRVEKWCHALLTVEGYSSNHAMLCWCFAHYSM